MIITYKGITRLSESSLTSQGQRALAIRLGPLVKMLIIIKAAQIGRLNAGVRTSLKRVRCIIIIIIIHTLSDVIYLTDVLYLQCT